ncbi:MAG: FMN-binding protein [Clostridiales bacterium]|nr:FMN-binding protein [Clostridiales bacterium]
MKKKIYLVVALVLAFALLVACSPEQPNGNGNGNDNDNVTALEGLADGVYTGKTEKDERGSYGEAIITISGEKITEAEYIEYIEEGKPKSKENGYEYEEALASFEALANELVEKQNVDEVDDYSGATGRSENFRTAVKEALKSTPAN